MRWWICAISMLAACIVALAVPALAQSKPEAKDMALLGSNDLQARSAYQPTIHSQGGRWIAYIGHHGGTKEIPKPRNPLTGADEFNGTSLVDVTDSEADNITRALATARIKGKRVEVRRDRDRDR